LTKNDDEAAKVWQLHCHQVSVPDFKIPFYRGIIRNRIAETPYWRTFAPYLPIGVKNGI
jgi:hypothetical protein